MPAVAGLSARSTLPSLHLADSPSLRAHWGAMPREDFCAIVIYNKHIHLLFWHRDPKTLDIS